jgi:L-threonylcarbamoyladenylate synthase
MTIYCSKDIQKPEVRQDIQRIIKAGGLIVFPTETVYGIGADATNPDAVKRIFLAKGRPSDNPLIVHLADRHDVETIVQEIPAIAIPLMDTYWPGPLTLIFQKKEIIPKEVSGGLQTVGVRIPSSLIAQEVIRSAGVPICAPSANISGKPSSTLFEHVKQDFEGRVDILVDGGQVDIGLESTVLDVTTPIPVLLRPGAVTKHMIEMTLGIGIIDATETKVEDVPRSPGMKYTHYAPRGKVKLIQGTREDVISFINQDIQEKDLNQVGVIAPHEYMKDIQAYYKVDLGSLQHLEEVGRNIFLALRQMDTLNLEFIYIPALPYAGLGQAIMNRLLKAAGNEITHV